VRPNSPIQTTNQCRIEQPALSQVIEERGEALVGGRHQAVLEVLKILPVRVPEVLAVVVPVDSHQWHPEFD